MSDERVPVVHRVRSYSQCQTMVQVLSAFAECRFQLQRAENLLQTAESGCCLVCNNVEDAAPLRAQAADFSALAKRVSEHLVSHMENFHPVHGVGRTVDPDSGYRGSETNSAIDSSLMAIAEIQESVEPPTPLAAMGLHTLRGPVQEESGETGC